MPKNGGKIESEDSVRYSKYMNQPDFVKNMCDASEAAFRIFSVTGMWTEINSLAMKSLTGITWNGIMQSTQMKLARGIITTMEGGSPFYAMEK